MVRRWTCAVVGVAVALGVAIADDLHKNSFTGKATQFVQGDANVKVEVKVHEISAERSRSLPSSERLVLNLGAGKNDTNHAYFFYPTPAAPITDDSSAELWVHSSKAGVRLMARVVFPKIRNPRQIDEPLTRLVLLDEYKAPAGGWQKLLMKRPAELLQAQKQALRLELKADPDLTDAYIDRLVLNLYTGPGEVEVFIDNLEISPVKPGAAPPKPVEPKVPGKAVIKAPSNDRNGLPVSYERGRLMVGEVQAFPRFIRYSGTPMLALKEAGFNSIYMPADSPVEQIEDAINNYGFWVIPYLQPIVEGEPGRPLTGMAARDANAMVANIRKFQSTDGVLFWDLGAVRSEDMQRVSRTVEAIRAADPRRPVGADVWDGFGNFAIPLQLIGTHRDPLLTTFELDKYNQWLKQRRDLAAGSKFTWTWVQTHLPEWQAQLMTDRGQTNRLTDPIGPQPEQIRILTYLALANGCKGIGYWSDKYLADAYLGRDRLLQLAILNQEIEMLQPVLMSVSGDIRWEPTSNKNVKVAIMKTNGKGLIAMPIWLGAGAQYVPPQGAAQSLTFKVPLVPDGAEPWEITPVRVQSLQHQLRQTPEGIQITLPEFDMTAAIVFTSDTDPEGLIAKWQKQIRAFGPQAASWACDLADEEYKKVKATQAKLAVLAPPIEQAEGLIRMAEKRLMEAKRARVSNNDELAYFDAIRAMRPLRILARAQWEQAVRTLDYPGATPYSVSFHTLPKHWELARFLREHPLGSNALVDGDFDSARPESRGVMVSALPGWSVQAVSSDEVLMDARIVPGSDAKVDRPIEPFVAAPRYSPTSLSKRIEPPTPPEPKLGAGVLRLRVAPKPVELKKGEKAPFEPQALERVFLCANSPPVRMPPGSWVRISGWIRVPSTIRASADGAMFFDTIAGEAYSVRVTEGGEWKQFHMYRKVPASGEVRVRLALTGLGTAYFDDVRIEPFIGSEGRQLPNPTPNIEQAGFKTSGTTTSRQ